MRYTSCTMTQETAIFLLGIVLFVTPFLGIPSDWKVYIYVGVAVLLLMFGYRLRYARFLRSVENENGERATDSFVEATPGLFNNKKRQQ